ncbi:unnamed protein product [Prunus armeniaca]
MQTNNTTRKQEVKASVQELASRAASRVKAVAAEKITPPNSAYQFEVSWRGLSGDNARQTSLLKAISPGALPQIFKNALTVPILLDIINEEMDLAVNYLDNLTRVPRFDTLIMFLSSSDNDAMHASVLNSLRFSKAYDVVKIWDEVLDNEATPIEYAEKLDNMHTKFAKIRNLSCETPITCLKFMRLESRKTSHFCASPDIFSCGGVGCGDGGGSGGFGGGGGGGGGVAVAVAVAVEVVNVVVQVVELDVEVEL